MNGRGTPTADWAGMQRATPRPPALDRAQLNQAMAGYSKTPLVKKLGIKDGFRIGVRSAPHPYDEIVDGLPATVRFGARLNKDLDMVHVFVADAERLPTLLQAAKVAIKKDGMIWVSWPKKSSGVPSTVTEDTIREVCLPMGLVDVKVCAVDEVWSGLRLVIRRSER